MRFRLATKPPLKPLKAWFDIPSDNSVLDVSGVKEQICSRLLQLVDNDGARFRPSEIELSLDDFELLDDSSLQVIKENDLICISKSKSLQKKRKASVDREPVRKKQKTSEGLPRTKLPRPSVSSSSSSSSTSEDETSTSESSSSESSSSESESESDSSSSTSSDSSVEVESSKLPQKTKPVLSKEKAEPLVPPTRPGDGKATTHSRNARRRAKRMHQKEQLQLEKGTRQGLPSGSANAIPLGIQKVVEQVQAEGTGKLQTLSPSPNTEQGSSFEVESMVTTLRNKNKKKGFKRTMEGLTPQRIIFDTHGAPPPESSTSNYYSAVAVTPSTPTPRAEAPRLVRPSEMQAQGLLPSNMFVTTVEVEGEKWDRSKKKKQRDTYGYHDGDGYVAEEVTKIQETSLNYGEPEVDWDSIERNWDNLPCVTDISSIKAGRLIGWQALAINPLTFTPETLVHLGRVKEINEASSAIILDPLRRPGAGVIAFGAYVSDDAERGGDADDESVEEEQCSFKDALESSWKLVD